MKQIHFAWMLTAALAGSLPAHAQETTSTRTVTLAATDWEPFTSANLPDGGLLAALAKAAFSRSGYQTELIILPWKRAVESVKAGDYDALAGAGYTEERTRYFHYPGYSFPTDLQFFAYRDRFPGYRRPADLCPASVGVLRGSRVLDILAATPCLKVKIGDDVPTNVRKLARKRIDLMVDTAASVFFILGQEFPEQSADIVALEPPLSEGRAYVVFSRANPAHAELAEHYDRGIESLKLDGTYEAILSQFGLNR